MRFSLGDKLGPATAGTLTGRLPCLQPFPILSFDGWPGWTGQSSHLDNPMMCAGKPPTMAREMPPTSLATRWMGEGCVASAQELEKTHE